MKSKIVTPSTLRFPDFNGDWEVKNLGVVCDIETGSRDTKDAEKDAKYPFFVRSDSVKTINSYSKNCEAILTSGDGVGVGKNFHYLNGPFDFHQRVYCLDNFKKGYLGSYIFQYFRENFFRRVQRLSAKNSVDSVRMDMISMMNVPFPDESEQQKIADFLSTVDRKICLLKEKHTLLTQYKKGVMQKLFEQEICFKDDNGNNFPDWQREPIGKYLQEYKERVSVDTDIPILTSSRTGLYPQERAVINEGEYGVVPKGYFTYRHMSDDLVFKFNINLTWERGAVSKEYPVFKTVGMNSYFLELCLNEGNDFKRFAIQQKVGGTRTRLYFKNLVKLKLNTPSLEEQNKIAEFLQCIDKKINAVKVQVELTQTFKKGLLQQMFV
ncbi:MAG: restriction endonuclease subunit S [Aliiglaciecola sp.]|uniref:restriction endonuclease subunit S n=1 Tax=Aliiglaciecola sp. TaxID=1872441 RepID=UPI0032980016